MIKARQYGNPIDFWLCEKSRMDRQFVEGYGKEVVAAHSPGKNFHLVGTSSHSKQYLVPRGTPPTAIRNALRNGGSGIYRFEIFAKNNDPCPEIYVGKTTDIAERIKAYIELTRRLLALRNGMTVRVDKYVPRFVHYRIALALWSGSDVKLSWSPSSGPNDQLEREEQLEIARYICEYVGKERCNYDKILNGKGSFRRAERLNDDEWVKVRDLFLKEQYKPLAV